MEFDVTVDIEHDQYMCLIYSMFWKTFTNNFIEFKCLSSYSNNYYSYMQ